MAKLDLKKISTAKAEKTSAGAGKVYKAIETGASKKGQQGKASPQEIEERRSALKTQGRKGAKAIRINMAFTPENHEFIRVMARATGQNMTEFCNLMLDAYREEHQETYKKAKKFIDNI